MGKIDEYSRIKYLVETLNKYTELYDEGHPAISDKEWDDLYFELVELEKRWPQWIFPNSPTQRVNYEVVNQLNKVHHNHPMLSLAKTKNLEEIRAFIGKNSSTGAIAMLKLDGLTCSLTYQDGYLVRAETRGNGEVGEDITHNAKVIKNIPKRIDFNDELIVDGEIICLEKDFEPFIKDYMNPRNFASGSIRLLDAKECARRNLSFVAWDCISPKKDTLAEEFAFLFSLGFDVVPWCAISKSDDIEKDAIDWLMENFTQYPKDGIVFKYDSVPYYNSLGNTAHHFNGGIAYKFYDETYETNLIDIDYDVSRQGILTPVAVFDEVEIEGSLVSRASLSNLSIMKETLGEKPYEGQLIRISKRNLIIPKVEWADKDLTNITDKQIFTIPKVCPICGQNTEIKGDFLFCGNKDCSGRIINRLDHIYGKKGLDIKGLSINTFNKLLDWGWIKEPADVFNLKEHRDEWVQKNGFGPKSVDNILAAIEAGRHQTLEKFISSLGIPGIGTTQSKAICSAICSYEGFKTYTYWDTLDGFGPVRAAAINNFNFEEADKIYSYLIFEEKNDKIYIENDKGLKGKTFVITGSVHQWKNRDELKAYIEALGGKVVGSVSKNTSYLINNDTTSTTAKNIKAQELGIPIISEEDFLKIVKTV